MRHHVRVRINALHKTQCFQIGYNLFARGIAFHALIGLRAHFHSDWRMLIKNIDHRQIMPPPDFEIVEIMRGGDFHRARTLFRVGMFIKHDRECAARPAAE